MSVGVRELKAKLSEYLARAQAGEEIIVTDHGKPKAVLAPVGRRGRIEKGIAEGWITPARRRSLAAARPVRGTRATADVLGDDRGD